MKIYHSRNMWGELQNNSRNNLFFIEQPTNFICLFSFTLQIHITSSFLTLNLIFFPSIDCLTNSSTSFLLTLLSTSPFQSPTQCNNNDNLFVIVQHRKAMMISSLKHSFHILWSIVELWRMVQHLFSWQHQLFINLLIFTSVNKFFLWQKWLNLPLNLSTTILCWWLWWFGCYIKYSTLY